MSDKANCQVCGFVSNQSYRYWSDADPRRLHSEPVVVWCILCVCMYPAHSGKSALIYLWTPIITTQFPSSQNARLVRVPVFNKERLEPMHVQQERATTYTDRLSIDFLRETFPHRFISRLDFVWAYFKMRWCVVTPQKLDSKNYHVGSVEFIDTIITQLLTINFTKRLNQCIAVNGPNLNGIILKTK